jgi:hypothetical protein
MDRREDSRGRVSHDDTPEQRSVEVVACPRCGLLAPVLPPRPDYDFPESRCARGHYTALVPAVHDYLRSRMGAAFS